MQGQSVSFEMEQEQIRSAEFLQGLKHEVFGLLRRCWTIYVLCCIIMNVTIDLLTIVAMWFVFSLGYDPLSQEILPTQLKITAKGFYLNSEPVLETDKLATVPDVVSE